MPGLGAKDHDVTKVYNASVAGTVLAVNANPQNLIYSISLFNATAADAYLQVFDKAAGDVTIGSTVPTFVLGTAGDSSKPFPFEKPIEFKTGFSVASTTTRDGSSPAIQEMTITYMDREAQ